MAVVPHGATQYTDGSTAGNKTLPLPSAVVAGDQLIMAWFNQTTTALWVLPTGWTQRANASQVNQGEIAIATRNATVTSGEVTTGSIVVNLQADFHGIAVALIAVAGWDTGTMIDVTTVTRSASSDFPATGQAETVEMPAITTVTDYAMVISGAVSLHASTQWSAKPSNMEQLVAGSSTDPANWWIGYGTQAVAGTWAQTSVDIVNQAEFELSFTMAIRPAVAAANAAPAVPLQPWRYPNNGHLKFGAPSRRWNVTGDYMDGRRAFPRIGSLTSLTDTDATPSSPNAARLAYAQVFNPDPVGRIYATSAAIRRASTV